METHWKGREAKNRGREESVGGKGGRFVCQPIITKADSGNAVPAVSTVCSVA